MITKNVLFTDTHYFKDTSSHLHIKKGISHLEVVSWKTLWYDNQMAFIYSGGSKPNAYMPRLQILYGY
jgi:hypothetical protein